ncbi:hypothetical protein [Nibrella saemangeumensis]|uniref:hypothetical protein n=1 Tax=Nibrella saemangeumensis TaxID=1084526 RepID=UPI0031F0CB84
MNSFNYRKQRTAAHTTNPTNLSAGKGPLTTSVCTSTSIIFGQAPAAKPVR